MANLSLQFELRAKDAFSKQLNSLQSQLQQVMKQSLEANASLPQGGTTPSHGVPQTQQALTVQQTTTQPSAEAIPETEQYQQTLTQQSTFQENTQLALANHHTQTEQAIQTHQAKKVALEKNTNQLQLAELKVGLGSMAALAKHSGGQGFAAFQAFAFAEAMVSAYLRASKTAASLPFPINAIAAAAELAKGIAIANQIASQSPPAAHGGLDYVPSEQTYLLDKGERVLSPQQNRDLTRYLNQSSDSIHGSSGSFQIDQMNVHILENATNIEALLRMDESDLRELLLARILPSARAVGGVGDISS